MVNIFSENNQIHFMQQNLHKSKEVTLEVIKWFENQQGKAAIAMVQEPNNHKGRISNLSKNLRVLGCDEGTNIRAAIITRRDFVCWKLNQFCTNDQAVIAFKSKNKTTVVASIYMPYDSIDPPPAHVTTQLISFCDSQKWELIIGADANSHHIAWGSTDNNTRGENLLDFIITTNLQICNLGNTPTFQNALRDEVIDITLTTTNAINLITNWKVETGNTISDHNKITFNYNTEPVLATDTFRNVKKTDWSKYRTLLNERLTCMRETFHREDLDNKAKLLETAIIGAFEESCPVKRPKTSHKPAWWTRELNDLKKENLRTKNRYKREPTEERKTNWKEASREYRRACRRAKNESWTAFCSDLQEHSAIAKLQKLMKNDKRIELGTIKKANNEYTKTNEETITELLRQLYPDSTRAEQNNTSPEWDNREALNVDEMINSKTVAEAVKSFKPYKSPGPDGIHPILLQQGLELTLPFLIDTFKESIKEKKPAETWMRTKAVFIPKPGKNNYTDPKAFRPISLSSFILKTLERIIQWKLLDTTLTNKPLSNNLYSYREGMSTDTALHNVVSKLEKSMENNELAIIVFLDISGAFSDASIEGLLGALERKNIQENLGEWIANMLSNRTVTASKGEDKVTKPINRGTPQGGILSPLIFNVDVDEGIEEINNNTPTEAHGYADDINVIGTGIDETTVANNIQNSLNRLEQWATKNSLAFNPSKTKAMLITRRRKVKHPKIFIQGKEVEYVKEFKYLGVTIDKNLTWRAHVENQVKKAQMALITGRRMIGQKWGLHPKQTLWLYKAIVRPILSYGSIVWINSLERKSIQKLLNKVQRTACMMITGAMKSTPTAGIEMMIGLPPISTHIKSNALSCHNRLIKTNTWRPKPGESLWRKGHTNMIRTLTKSFPDLMKPQDGMIKTERLTSKFEVEIGSREDIPKLRPKPLEVNTINCYTDGSKTGRKAGAAYIYMGENLKSQESTFLGDSTVFQAEIIAIYNACTDMLSKNLENLQIRFYVDSQSAIRAINKFKIKNKLVLECKELLNQLSENNQVRLSWVPGHEGHMGNEVADRLAKRGTIMEQMGPEPIIPNSNSVLKQQLKEWEADQHSKEWNNREDCRQTKLMIPTKNKKWEKEIINSSRKNIRTITQIVTGHANLKRHRYLMGLEVDPICDKCQEEEETMEHLLTKCPAFSKERDEIIGWPITTMGNISKCNLKDICKFVKYTGRLKIE